MQQFLGMNGLSQVSQLLEPARPWSDLQWGLCIFDDLVEYTGPECQKYESIFLARLLACVSSPQPEVRQAAAYGCGVLGQFGGPGLAAAAAQAIPLLCDVIQAPDGQGCPRCGGYVYHADQVFSKDRVWHKGCFKCQICHRNLDSRMACDAPDNNVYCTGNNGT